MADAAARASTTSRTASVGVGLVVFGAANFAFLGLAGRDLGAAGVAPVAVAWTLLNAVGIGLFQPLEQEAARVLAAAGATGPGGRADLRHVLRLALGAWLGTAVLGAAALVPLASVAFHGRRDMVLVLVLGLGGQAVAYLARGVLAGTGRFPRYGAQLLADGVLRTGGAVALFLSDGTPGAYGAVLVLAPLLATLVTAPPSTLAAAATGDRSPVRRRLGALVAASTTGQLLANAGPVAMAGLAQPGQEGLSGRFVAAVTIARVPLFLFAAVQAVFLPSLAALLAARDDAGFRRAVRRALAATAALGGVGVVAVWLLGEPAMRLVYGPEFHLAPATLALVAVSAAVFMLAQVLAQALLAHHADAAVAAGWAVGLVVTGATLALDAELATRVALALCTGALAGLCAHAVSLRAAHRRWTTAPGVVA